MKCTNCEFENPNGTVFCQVCGSKLTEEKDEKEKEKAIKLNKKVLIGIIAGAALLLLLILALCLVFSGKSSEITAAEHSIIGFYDSNEECSYIIYDTKVLGKVPDTEFFGEIYTTSINGDTALLQNGEDDLYLVTKKGVEKIASDVANYHLSRMGNMVYYVTNDSILYSLDVKTRKTEKIADDLVPIYSTWYDIVLSPDGKTVLYTFEDDDEKVLMAYSKKEYRKIGKDCDAYAVSDGGEYIFFKNSEGAFYVTSFKTEEKEKIASSATNIYFNDDKTNVVFVSDSKLYISNDGKEREKIGSVDSIYSLTMKDHDSFVGAVLSYTRDNDYYLGVINNKFELEKISSLSNKYNYGLIDGNSVFFENDENLYKTEFGKSMEKEKLVSDIDSFRTVNDGNAIYYIDSDDTLWYKSGDKDSVKITDDVEYLTRAYGDYVYFVKDIDDYETGTLYCCRDGKNKVRIDDEVAAYVFSAKYGDVYIKMNDVDEDEGLITYSIFAGVNSKNFKCILRDMVTED